MMWNIEDKPLGVTTEEFLRVLFDKWETIFLRLFDDQKRSGSGINMTSEIGNFAHYELPELLKKNEEGYGVFFVVNGGGQTDKEVITVGSCKAQFMECDDKTIAEQLEQINSFPLEPSAVVRSKKSLHCYWFTPDGDIKQFRRIQIALAKHFDGDPKIVNESRVMRLPGFNHCKGDPFPVRLIHWKPDLVYTQEEISKHLPKLEPERSWGRTAGLDPVTVSAPERSSGSVPDNISVPDSVQEGGRVNALVSFIGRLKHTFMNDDEIRSAVIAFNESRCVPPLSEVELQREVFPAIKRFPSEPPKVKKEVNGLVSALADLEPEKRFKWSDLGNGELFAEVFRYELRWNTTAKEWFHYDGRVWSEDPGGLIAQAAARELQKALLIYSLQIQDAELQQGYQKHVLRMSALSTRKRMLEDARSYYFVRTGEFDTDPMLLNLQNGVLDLRSFTLIPHDPDLMLSKVCNADYDPEADAPLWNRFLFEVMQGNEEKARFLQKAAGTALTGNTREETCFLLYGKTTRNGKGTFVETIGGVLGDYALTMSPNTLAKKHEDSRTASPDIARLKGCRFLNASEPEKSMVFDTALLKTLLGRDTITARFLFENEFQFVPEFKLFINTNYLPVVKDETLFTSGRINVITFDRHFSEEEQDKDLKDKLKAEKERSGVLNWLIEGLMLYRSEGLKAPECVAEATKDYQLSGDKLINFLNDRYTPEPGSNVSGDQAYFDYMLWCQSNDYSAESKTSFYKELRNRDILKPHGTVGRYTERNVISGYANKRASV